MALTAFTTINVTRWKRGTCEEEVITYDMSTIEFIAFEMIRFDDEILPAMVIHFKYNGTATFKVLDWTIDFC